MLAWKAHCFGARAGANAAAPLGGELRGDLDDWRAVRRSTVVLALEGIEFANLAHLAAQLRGPGFDALTCTACRRAPHLRVGTLVG